MSAIDSARAAITEVQAYLRLGGILTARESDLANALQALVSQSQPSAMEGLLDTRQGLALAHTAWSEGSGAMLRACNEEGTWRKPENPYSAPLLAYHAGSVSTAPDQQVRSEK